MKKLLQKLFLILIIFSNIIFTNAQWIEQNSGTTNSLSDVYFINADTGYVVGANGSIRKTTNGGFTWSSQLSNSTNYLNSVQFISANTGYVVGNNGTILKTTNGGINWIMQTSLTINDYLSVYFINADIGFVVGRNGTILKTTDGGNNWVLQISGTTNLLSSVYFLSINTGFAVGQGGTILKTINGGITWTFQTSGTSSFLSDINFQDPNTGYIVGNNGTILKTNNGGSNWILSTINSTSSLKSVSFSDTNIANIVDFYGTIFKSINGGTTWIIQTNISQSNLNSIYYSDLDTAYIVGGNGKILKTTSGGWCTGIPVEPIGDTDFCSPSNNFNYSTIGAPFATSYSWSLNPNSAGIISGSGTNAIVTWSTSYNGNASVIVKGERTGCIGESSSLTVTINNSIGNPGFFGLSIPTNGIWESTKPFFQWNESIGSYKYTLYVDGIVKKDNIFGTSYQIPTNDTILSGIHTWSVIANNACYTTQSNETRSFIVDATPPSSFSLISPLDSSWTTSTQPTLSWSSSSDAHSGLAKYQLWIDGVLNRDNISTASTSTTPTSALSNGSHTWEIRAVDNVGNVRSSNQIRTVRIDNIPPGDGLSTCLYYNGTGNYVVVLDNQYVRMSAGMTIEAWINFQSGGSNSPRIISKQTDEWGTPGDYAIYLNGTGTSTTLAFWINGITSISSNSTIYQNNWYHIACVYNGTQMKIYINGVLDKVQSVIGTHTPTTTNLTFGRKGVGSNYLDKFKGNLDEIRFWNIERTQTQINTYKNVAIDYNSTNLVGYWRFNKGSGNTAFDNSSSYNNGTINGVTFQNSTLPVSSSLCILKTPIENTFISTNTPMFNWNSTYDSGIGFKKFQLWIDGNLIKDNLSDTIWTIINPLVYGQHTWSVKGYDSLDNNQSSYQSSFFVDNVSPNPFNLTSPTNNEIVMFPTPNLSWQSTLDSTGGSGMKKYQLWINGVVNRDSISMNTTTVSPANVLPQGAYTWFVKAYDNVGNIRQSTETRVFYVDWEAPTAFELVSPSNNQTLSTPYPTFVWHPSSDIGSGLDRYEITISGYQPIVVLATDTLHSLTFNLPNGNYSWFVKAFDQAGAFTSSNTNSFTINVPLPEQAATPTGTNELCIGSQTTTYTTTGANYAENYVWEITPSSAGTISGTGTTGTVNWNATFSGIAQITVKGQNIVGFGLTSLPFVVTVHHSTIPGTISGSGTICLGQPTGTLTLSNYSGTILKWQKRLNGGSWSDINNTSTTFFETPLSVGLYEYKAEVQNEICPSLFSSIASVTVGTVPADPGIISGPATVCSNQYGVTYSITPINDATYYQWTLPSGVSGVSTSNSINANFTTSAQSGFITVKGTNSCGDGVVSTKAITVNPLPADAGIITGNATVCQGETSVTYTVPTINYATSYVWTKPNGVTGTSSTNSITFNYGTTAVSGNITVKGTNSCGDGVVSTKSITVNPLPAAAGTISGSSTVCQGQNSVTYTVPSISNATSYLWTLPNGAIGTSTTNSITVDFNTSATSGNITVKGTNACGDGVVSTKAITINPLPAAAGTISGSSTVCQGQNSVTYTVPSISNATSYVWTLPTGATGTSTTNSITVSYGTTAISGNITVKGTNSCGDGVVSTKAITVNPLPDAAGTISGNATVCQGENLVTYSVPDINNATSYVWTLPTGAVGTSTTNSITINYGINAISGNITVKGTNSCGNGVIATKAITVNPLPAAAGTISGSANVCQGQNGVTYTVPNIANATTYIWSLPNGATGTSTTNSIIVSYSTTATSGNITVKGTNACGEGVVSSKAITVYPLPDAAGIISGSSTVCQGENAIVYTISAITNATSYIWTLPNGATGTSTINSISVNYGASAISGNISVKGSNSCGEGDISTKAITVKNRSTNTLTENVCDTYTAPDGQVYTTSGIKTAILTNSVGCDSVITINLTVKQSTSQTLTETVCDTYTAPDGQVYTNSGTKTAIIANAVGCDSVITINLIVNYSPVTPTIVLDFDKLISSSGSGNQWFNQNGMIPNETNQELVLTENGTYYVIVTQNDCSSDPSNSIIVNNVLVQKFDKNLIVISPNPFTNQLTIKNQTSETYQYTMYNGVGQILFKGTLESEVMLNTSDLSTGLYIIKFVNSLGQVYYKVVKQ